MSAWILLAEALLMGLPPLLLVCYAAWSQGYHQGRSDALSEVARRRGGRP